MENVAISIIILVAYLVITGFLAHRGWKETKIMKIICWLGEKSTRT